ncbi:MAG: DUF502 domain-containing protein [Opitutaceae bacterium]|nr:DUF502 domain-containing protein [Cephaloticoccus sp.]MCP5530732.1 DUF502 domain-containing protein [Opitutaceae bacterium]
MRSTIPTATLRASGRWLGRHFMRGVLILAPIAITISLLHWIFQSLDGLLRPFIDTPGLGFLIVLVSFFLVGWFASFLPINGLLRLLNRWLESLPGVNFIYTSVRDFFKAFVGNKRRFKHTVRVQLFTEDVWLIGFLTDEDVQDLDLGKDFVAVYVPQAYNVAGQLYLVRRERVHRMPDLRPGDAMKYTATGGAIDLSGPD